MEYELKSKNDISGPAIVINFPEEKLDKKALYTIQSEWPEFLVPFSYRSIDGMAECTYRIGDRNKFQYHYGFRSVSEYVDLWVSVLQPMLDCDDWFLKPLNFVLDSRYLYIDKSGVISYLYIPAVEECGTFETLRTLAVELSQKNGVTDAEIENKVLRAIMQNFQPKSFLAMLRSAERSAEKIVGKPDSATSMLCPGSAGMRNAPNDYLEETLKPENPKPEQAPFISQNVGQSAAPSGVSSDIYGAQSDEIGDICINISDEKSSSGKRRKEGAGKRAKEKTKPKKEHKSLFGRKKEKPEKEKSIFGAKKGMPNDVVLGAAGEIRSAQNAFPAGAAASDQFQFRPAAQPSVSYDSGETDEVTQLDDVSVSGSCYLTLVGDLSMPRIIAVGIQQGQAFTIGRFDVSLGRKQSDFEFEKGTKAVSRHHAAIERDENGYSVVDLASSAGTFVDGIKLVPNVPQAIANGSRISFGTGGADYVWSE